MGYFTVKLVVGDHNHHDVRLRHDVDHLRHDVHHDVHHLRHDVHHLLCVRPITGKNGKWRDKEQKPRR
ncbi:hypothetical protein ACSBR1_001210 [Camellia fascicularis]